MLSCRPLPPAERTVGSLVAETIRLYGDRFWRALPLGIPLAGATQLGLGRAIDIQIVILCLSAPVFSAAYVYAIRLALSLSPPRSVLVRAWWVGMLVWIPAPILLRAFVLPSLAWLAFWGLAVPVLVCEGGGARAALGRGRRLATADYVHALGSLCALLLVVEPLGRRDERAPAQPGGGDPARGGVSRAARPQPAPLPRRVAPLSRSSGQGRLDPIRPKGATRCRSSSSSRR